MGGGAAAVAAPLFLSLLHALLSCLTFFLLLAKLFCQPAAAGCRAVAALAAANARLLRRSRPPPGAEEEQEEGDDPAGDNRVRCAVCLCPVRPSRGGDEAWRLGCGHLFHGPCLRPWVWHHRSTCPLCRAYLPLPRPEAAQPEAAFPSGAETVVIAPFSFSGVGDTGKWWLR